MKDKILTFVIGMLVGAILVAGGFSIYQRLNKGVSSNGIHQEIRKERLSKENFDENAPRKHDRENKDDQIPPQMPNDKKENNTETNQTSQANEQ